MHLISKRRLAEWAACALLAGAGVAPALGAGVQSDVLDRPALTSAKAASLVMLATTRAGKRIVAVGERGIIVISDDDGRTWRQVQTPVSVSLTNVRFVDASKGWVVGHGGVVLHTQDGGASWVKQLDGRQAAQLLLEAAKAGHPGAGADAQRALADAQRTVDEGPGKPFLDVHFFDDNNGLIVGAFGLIFATSDGGKTWQPALDRVDNPKGKHLYSMQADGVDCFIVGEQGAVFRSRDHGKTFATLNTPYAGTYFGVVLAAPQTPVVFGLRGNIYWSRDAGANWQKSDISAPSTLTAGLRLADGALVLVDETGRVFLSKDSGRSAKPVPMPQPFPFTGIVQANDGGLVLSGARGATRVVLTANQKETAR